MKVVVVDYSKCQGHGQCAAVAPRVFELGDDDRAHLLLRPGTNVEAQDEGAVDDAIAMCPEAALSWRQPEAR